MMNAMRYQRVMFWTGLYILLSAGFALHAGFVGLSVAFLAAFVASSLHWAFYRLGSLFHTADRLCAGGLCVLLLAVAPPAQVGSIVLLLVGVVVGYRQCLRHDGSLVGMVWHLGFRCCGFWAGMVAIGSPLTEPAHWPLVTLGYVLLSVLVTWIPASVRHRHELPEIAL